MKSKIFAVIPARNEEPNIRKVINETKKYISNIIVVDDGSKDKTFEEMISIMKAEDKNGLIYIEAYNYGGCSPYLRKNVFENEKRIAQIESTFVIFWVDWEKDRKSETGIFKRYNCGGIPTVVLINKKGEMINKVVGFGDCSGKAREASPEHTMEVCLEKHLDIIYSKKLEVPQ